MTRTTNNTRRAVLFMGSSGRVVWRTAALRPRCQARWLAGARAGLSLPSHRPAEEESHDQANEDSRQGLSSDVTLEVLLPFDGHLAALAVGVLGAVAYAVI